MSPSHAQTLRLRLPEGESLIRILPGGLSNTRSLDAWTADRDIFVLTDETVARLYLGPFLEQLQSRRQEVFVIQPGESSKTLVQYERIIHFLVEHHFGRDMLLIGLGGGIVGDLGGFVASTYHRGIDYLLCPTTLIAQTDASIGGKTAVNLSEGKNLIGAFHHPLFVYIDPLVLRTLPPRELHAGFAEVIKYGVALDQTFFEWLEQHLDGLLELSTCEMQEAIRMALTLKIQVVEADPEERLGRRAVLNLGHTFGHAIETASDYRILHGEAVAIGMLMAAEFSVQQGWLEAAARDRIQTLLARAQLTLALPPLQTEHLLPYFSRDKKNFKGSLNLVLLEALGKAILTDRFSITDLVELLNHWPRGDRLIT